jgi:hypothetical protein
MRLLKQSLMSQAPETACRYKNFLSVMTLHNSVALGAASRSCDGGHAELTLVGFECRYSRLRPAFARHTERNSTSAPGYRQRAFATTSPRRRRPNDTFMTFKDSGCHLSAWVTGSHLAVVWMWYASLSFRSLCGVCHTSGESDHAQRR